MSTSISLFRRARFLAVALVLALVAASCGGGDESVSSRTRNAGAAPTIEECAALFGEQISPEEEEELFREYEDSWARFEDELANWAQHSGSVDEQGAAVGAYLAHFQSLRGLSPGEADEAMSAWMESEEGAAVMETFMRQEEDEIWARVMISASEVYEMKQMLTWSAVVHETPDAGLDMTPPSIDELDMVDEGDSDKYMEGQALVDQFADDLEKFRIAQNGRNDESLTEEERKAHRENYSELYKIKEKSAVAVIEMANELGMSTSDKANLDERFLKDWENQVGDMGSISGPDDSAPEPDDSVPEPPEESVPADVDDTIPDDFDDARPDSPEEAITQQQQNVDLVNTAEENLAMATQLLEEMEAKFDEIDVSEAMNATDRAIKEALGIDPDQDYDFSDGSNWEDFRDEALATGSEEVLSAWDNEQALNQENDALNESYNQAYDEVYEAQNELADVKQMAINTQSDSVNDWGEATANTANMTSDEEACELLAEALHVESAIGLLEYMEYIRAQYPGLPDEVINVLAGGDAGDAGDGADADGGDGIDVVVDGIPVTADDDTQVQIPTVVMLADDATVEIEEVVDEIVVTPAAAKKILTNTGVTVGAVQVMTDGEWQAVPASEPLVVPVTADDEDVEIRVVPADSSKPVVTQTVDLKRVGVQQLLTPEELAALLPASSDDDSSSLMWLLYVVIGVLAIAAAVLFGQRRKASAS